MPNGNFIAFLGGSYTFSSILGQCARPRGQHVIHSGRDPLFLEGHQAGGALLLCCPWCASLPTYFRGTGRQGT